MSSVNVVRELEELRSMLDTPKKVYTPGSRLESTPYEAGVAASSTRASTIASLARLSPAHGAALQSAERSVDRLGRAIEAAEEEMDAALRRTTDLHKNQIRQKDLEMQELQRLLLAKEKAIESLRDTLATTKRTYDSRLSQAEANLSLRDSEATAAREELRMSRLEMESVSNQLKHTLKQQALELEDLRLREAELQSSNRGRAEEATRLAAQLRVEAAEKRAAGQEAEDLRRQVSLLTDELHQLRNDARVAKERNELEIEDLKRRLRGERGIRKACEKWLRAELKSREEYDMLLTAIRETASGNAGSNAFKNLDGLPRALAGLPGVGAEAAEVELLLHRMKAQAGISSPGGEDYAAAAAGGGPAGKARAAAASRVARQLDVDAAETDLQIRKMEEDNRRLKAELIAAKRLLLERK